MFIFFGQKCWFSILDWFFCHSLFFVLFIMLNIQMLWSAHFVQHKCKQCISIMYTFETHDEKKEKCQCQCKGENEEWRDESDRKRKIERKSGRRSLFVIHNRILYIYRNANTSHHLDVKRVDLFVASSAATLCINRAYLLLLICLSLNLAYHHLNEPVTEGYVWRADDECVCVCVFHFWYLVEFARYGAYVLSIVSSHPLVLSVRFIFFMQPSFARR